MADKKTSNKSTSKHSGFDAPCKGVVLSKNTIIKKNADGTISLTAPKRAKK